MLLVRMSPGRGSVRMLLDPELECAMEQTTALLWEAPSDFESASPWANDWVSLSVQTTACQSLAAAWSVNRSG